MNLKFKRLAAGLVMAFLPCLLFAQPSAPATAKVALQFAEPAALSWAPDAALVLVGTGPEPGMFANGNADMWNFAYYSAAKDSARTFFADKVRLIHQEPPAGQLPSLQAIGSNWLNTDAVARITESRGGGAFRAAHQNIKVLASVGYNVSQPPDTRPGEKLWVVVYAAFEDSTQVPTALLRFELAAGSGGLIPLERSVQTSPPTGENLAFLNEQDDTLAVLNLQSGNLDSLAVAAFPGILPDTTNNEKTVPRFYNVSAYPAGVAFSATLTLYYTQAEFDASGASSESGLQLFRNDGAAWQLAGGVADPLRNLVTVTGVTQFSNWAFADPSDQVLRVEQANSSSPETFQLRQNYPNPFNPTTTITYTVPPEADASNARLEIFNVNGQKVRTLVNQTQRAGEHVISWDGKDGAGAGVASGVYLYRLRVGNGFEVRRMALLR